MTKLRDMDHIHTIKASDARLTLGGFEIAPTGAETLVINEDQSFTWVAAANEWVHSSEIFPDFMEEVRKL